MTGYARPGRLPGLRKLTGPLPASLRRGFGHLRWYLRELTGESGYDRYVERHRWDHPGAPPLSRTEFERRRTDRDGQRPTARCC